MQKIIDHLVDVTGRKEVGEELKFTLAKIDELVGMGSRVVETRRLGFVESLGRIRPGRRPAVLGMRMVRTGSEGRTISGVKLYRDGAAPDQALLIHIRLFSSVDTVLDKLTHLASGVPEVVVDTNSYVTRVAFEVFDPRDGELLDQYEKIVFQGINFGIVARGQTDSLAKPFKGAPTAQDLTARPRVHTISFPGPSFANRSGAFDALNRNRSLWEVLILR